MYFTDPGLASIMAIFMPLTLALFFLRADFHKPLSHESAAAWMIE